MNKIIYVFVWFFQLGILASQPVEPLPECCKHSVYLDCGPNCPQTCEWFSKPCTLQSSKCIPGCYCKDGYVREKDQCYRGSKICCQENEIYDIQDPACEKNCYNKHKDCHKSSRNPIKGCFCKDKFVRNDNGKCVSYNQCSVKCDRDHEVYDSCPNTCIKTCDNPNGIGEWDATSCKPKCMCEDGYVRNKNNDCILQKHCPVTCGTNEEYSSCGFDFICNKKSISEQCEAGCFCSPGYVREKQNKECIPKSACTQSKCNKHEIYLNCGTSCPQTCDWFNKPCTLLAPSRCHPGCYCKNGYVRENDKCVKGKKVCCHTHEAYKLACPSCEKTCANPSGTCTETTQKYGCYCADGYVRNEATDTCIPESNCPPPSCEKHETHMSCGPKCPQTCEYFFNTCKIDSNLCKPGCYCEDGYVRIEDKCVRGNKVCCPKNEILNHSHPSCESTCDDPNRKICNLEREKEKRCHCMDGYVRNKAGICVPPTDCPLIVNKCGTSLEVYDPCTETCTKTCTNPSGSGDCKKGSAQCVCIDGYLRDEDHNCVLPHSCPKNFSPEQHCGKHEHYSNCEIDNMCNKKNMATTCCSGCFCNHGYARQSKTGKCVPESHCSYTPSCLPNEEYLVCGPACPKNCFKSLKDLLCIEKCVEGCFCQKGFLRNKHGDCVTKSECFLLKL